MVNNQSIIDSAIIDIKKGMPITEFDRLYPELKEKKQVFTDFSIDIAA